MHTLRYEKHSPKYVGQDMMEFIAGAKFEDLPPEVVLRAKHIVMDGVACMLAGRKTRELFGSTWDFLAEDSCGTVRPVGCQKTTSVTMAAFLNALHAQTHDFNDGLNNSGMLGGAYHPGRTVVSVALAVGQKVQASGKDILLAVVLGIEAAARMRNPSHKAYIADSYSAAVTAAKLMGADAAQVRAAVTLAAHAGFSFVGKKVPFLEPFRGGKSAGHTTKPMGYAYIARNGIEAAMMAMQGFDGPGLDDNNAHSTRFYSCGLGREFQCMDMYFKPWPCCRKVHGGIDAALTLRNQYGVQAEDIESISIYQQATGMYVNTPFDGERDINYGGQFSLQYTVACAFLDGEVSLRHFRQPEGKAPQAYVDFGKKIKVYPDNGLDGHNAIAPNHCVLEATLKDGRLLSLYCKYPLGAEPNPMTEEHFIAKLRHCAEDMTPEQQDELIRQILTMDC